MTLKDYLRFELRTRVYDDPIFSGVPSEQVLAAKLHANPYFPFTYIGQGETLELALRQEGFFFAACVFVLSTSITVAWFATNYAANGFLPLAAMGIVVSAAVGYRFRHIHRYILYPNEYQYEFASGDYIHVRGDFSNIYVRLLRETAESSQRSRMYYLVLNGYEMDRQILCSPTRNLEELRKLGQRIASNLNINYFDEANISKHHVIRHFRSDKAVFSYREAGQIANQAGN